MAYAWIKDYSNGFSMGTAFKIAIYTALRNEDFEIFIPLLDVQVKQNDKNLKLSDKEKN